VFVESPYARKFWLFVDMPSECTLGDLDGFLRRIWLECCDHLSDFYERREELSMDTEICELIPGEQYKYVYDYGTTTELVVTVKASCRREESNEDVRLLARNVPPVIPCGVCGGQAVVIDNESERSNPLLCVPCAGKLDLEVDYMLPLANSPRAGLCGYGGELDVWTSPPQYEGP